MLISLFAWVIGSFLAYIAIGVCCLFAVQHFFDGKILTLDINNDTGDGTIVILFWFMGIYIAIGCLIAKGLMYLTETTINMSKKIKESKQ